VPQGLILGPIPVNFCVNGLGEGTENILSKFADDAKLGGVIYTLYDFDAIWRDLQKAGEMCTEGPHEVQQREIPKSCPWGGITPCTSTGWGLSSWKAAWQRRPWGSW